VDFVCAPGPLDNATRILASASSLDIIALGFTSNSYVSDDDDLANRLMEESRGRPVVNTGQALLAAIAALNAKNVMLVDPPWFPRELTQRGQKWLGNEGANVVWSGMADIPSGQTNVHPTGVYRWLRRNIPPHTDLILTGGNGFRTVGVIRAIEADTGIPMVTANSALLWHSLKTLGYPADAVTRYGCLFQR
jgi:maleate isomerase